MYSQFTTLNRHFQFLWKKGIDNMHMIHYNGSS